MGVAVALGGLETTLRLLDLGYGSSPVESDPFLHHVHPRNYSFIQRHPSGELGGFDIEYDAEGRVFRGRNVAPTGPANATCRIAIMGDSFAEAGQVPFIESYPGRLEASARDRCEVRNYGVRSYSPAVYLVQWEREIRAWKPTHVFLLVFGNDIPDDQGYLAVATVDADGLPTAIPGPEGGWLTTQLRRLYVARFVRTVTLQAQWAWEHRGQDLMRIGGVVEENPDWTTPTTSMLLALHQRITAEQAKVVLMAVPSRYKLMGDNPVKVDRDFHRQVQDWAGQNGLPFLDLDTPFERAGRAGIPLFFRQDIHFNAEGHGLTAATIGRAHPDLFPHWAEIVTNSVRAAYTDSAAR